MFKEMKMGAFMCSLPALMGARGKTTAAPEPITRPSPHVVVLIIDDAGTQDVGFSSKLQLEMMKDMEGINNITVSPIQTPFLDSIAQDSVLFPQYYTHPTCTPSRAALMTGKYAFKVGMPFPIVGPGSMIGLDPTLKTMANHFQDSGYATHMVGKWHLGHAKDIYRPPRRGFDTFMGCVGGGFDHYTKSVPGCLDLWNTTSSGDGQLRQFSKEEIDTTQHATDLFSNEAIQLIQQHDVSKPFFLYLSYTSPHAPLQADDQYVSKCRTISNKTRRLFCAMMMQLDGGIHRVVNAMEDRGMWDDTYFVFTTDNGGMPVVGGFNYPYRGSKAEAWDGGVRGPAMFRFPRRNTKRTTGIYHGLVHIADWLPTLVSATSLGVDLGSIDGVDHFSTLESNLVVANGDKAPDLSRYPRTSIVPQADLFLNVSVVRDGCHKLILGAPGFNQVYGEPDHRLFKNISFLHSILERLFPIIEWITPDVATQFLKYFLRAITESIYASLENSKHYFDQVTFVRSHTLSTVTASYQDEPITVQWNASPGPMVFLYNLCADPSESVNLALEGQQDVERLYEILSRETGAAPVQFAGDVTLRNAQPSWSCSPFLDDDETILSSEDGKSLNSTFLQTHGAPRRLFVRMVAGFVGALLVTTVAVVATTCFLTKKAILMFS